MEANTDRPQIVLVNRCIIRNEDGDLLLVKRKDEEDGIYNGLWECPGGKLDTGQDLSDALERAVMEETGYLAEPTSRLVFADSKILPDGKYIGLPYVVLFGLARVVGGKFKLTEHSDSVWTDYDSALDYELTPETRKALIVLGPTILDIHRT